MNQNIRFNLVLAGAALLCGVLIFASWPRVPTNTWRTEVAASAFCADLSPALSLTGRAAYAEDLQTHTVLYAKNAETQLPLASLTKLMTILTASEILSPDDTVTISKEALAIEGDSGLRLGERWRVKDLIDFTLVVSSNDGAHALALAAAEKAGETNEAFIARMNAKAHILDLGQTFFIDDTGLDISTTSAGAYGSARDVAAIISYIARTDPTLIEGTTASSATFKSLDGYVHRGENTSLVISSLDGAIGSKTGFTDLAGGNLAVVFEPIPGRPVAAVILGSTRDGRDTDMEALAASAKTTLRREMLCTADTTK